MERLRASTVCVVAGRVLLVQLRDPKTGIVRLFPPGGAVEAGETPAETAVRETLEETGYKVRVQGAARVDHYPFVWAGTEYDCETHFFRADLAEPDPVSVRKDPVVVGAEWVPLSGLSAALDFDQNIRESVLALAFR
ncbi:MAG: NUDIX hydrolase [Bdellovibrionales bacterium]|nr:NUDIX hydrolase [Bdellovibrionales bacterium]MCB0418733.1 NUDIX hydrolase [Bdellovibrionales bacterium]MCB9253650.1 NUDIX hydrolase [Pseudobdellovibrionaceae bacterium]